MKIKQPLAVLLFAALSSVFNTQARDVTSFNDGWEYSKGVMIPWGVYPNIYVSKSETVVNLPHSFNDVDLMNDDGYYRGEGSYTKRLQVPEEWQGKRIFIKFEGAAQVADVQVNFVDIARHKGAYNAFAVELTDYLTYGKENFITVTCNNAHDFSVATQSGDFNVPGGLYRDVWLEVTDDVCISPLYYGSEGVLLHQRRVSEDQADLQAEVHLLSKNGNYKDCEVEFSLLDADGNTVASKRSSTIFNDIATINLCIEHPHLWNGQQDPYLYTMVTKLYRNGKEIDRVEEKTGFKYFSIDAEKGFFLNGKYLKLRGVCRHQDRPEIASALHREHHLEDLDMIEDMGANALRLAHYPQAHFMFEEADRRGLLVWEEIPFISFYSGHVLDENLRLQLREMIIQNYNHPSIFCWGIFNEVPGDHMAISTELNSIAHQLDPSRMTTAATCWDGDFNFITDLLGWNKYFGWYDGTVDGFTGFFDNWHAEHPDVKICLSEYGAGAALSQHISQFNDEEDKRAGARSRWHPIEKQTNYHRAHIRMISERDYIWGSFVWNMFDFSSAMRREGDTNNLNDKGLVSFDRKHKKDAFYLFKANWNKQENTVHLCSKEYKQRKETVTDIIAFTTAPSVKLYLNGKLIGTQKTDNYKTVEWKDVQLQPGLNKVEICTVQGNDSAEWIVE